jgi:hypothetical protein
MPGKQNHCRHGPALGQALSETAGEGYRPCAAPRGDG